MDFVTARELRASSASVWKKLEAGEEIVITRNGKPFALLVHTEPQELEEKLLALRRMRLQSALAETRRDADRRGIESMTMEEIDEEIARTRTTQGRS